MSRPPTTLAPGDSPEHDEEDPAAPTALAEALGVESEPDLLAGPPAGLDRRVFLGLSLTALPVVGLATASLRATQLHAAAQTIAPAAKPALPPPAPLQIELRVNGTAHRLAIDPRTTLLDALREDLALPGSKKGCDHGQCGACTVLVDNRRVLSCLTLAATVAGRQVTTIEGLAEGDHGDPEHLKLHPMQEAFLRHDAFQCGYCTPGQIVSAVGLLAEGCPADPAAIRECMSGNLCRCGAYPNIVAAVAEVRGRKGA